MEPDINWVIVEVDGKVAAVSPDFKLFAAVAAKIARLKPDAVSRVTCRKAPTSEIARLARTLAWDDLAPFGSRFQKHVWHSLFTLTHPNPIDPQSTATQSTTSLPTTPQSTTTSPQPTSPQPTTCSDSPYSRLLSYTDFARLCGNEPGTRAVAHAVALNPIAVIIPCHLIVPKETIDRIRRIEREVAPTLFGSYILATAALDFGPYRYGTALKRSLILSL